MRLELNLPNSKAKPEIEVILELRGPVLKATPRFLREVLKGRARPHLAALLV